MPCPLVLSEVSVHTPTLPNRIRFLCLLEHISRGTSNECTPKKETAPVPEGTDAVRACSVSFYAQIFEHDFVSDKEKIRRHTVVWQGFLTLSPAKSAEKMCGKDAKQALKMVNLPEFMRWLFSWSLPEQERRCHAFSATIPTGWERSRWSCKYPLRCPPSWERRSSGWNPDP